MNKFFCHKTEAVLVGEIYINNSNTICFLLLLFGLNELDLQAYKSRDKHHKFCNTCFHFDVLILPETLY